MRPDQVPQAAVDAAVECSRRRGRLLHEEFAADLLAAAAPLLINDAMVERAARCIWDDCWGDADATSFDSWDTMVKKGEEPGVVRSVRGDATTILRAALGGDDA